MMLRIDVTAGCSPMARQDWPEVRHITECPSGDAKRGSLPSVTRCLPRYRAPFAANEDVRQDIRQCIAASQTEVGE
jgi:hypothetical protein